MRFLFILVVFANLALFLFGQGFFGPAPGDAGRTLKRLPAEVNAAVVQLGEPSGSLRTR